jgi:hypothetical protein
MWILVATSCSGCGSQQAVLVLNQPPTDEDEAQVADKLGGMYCIRVARFQGVVGEVLEAVE